VATARSRSADIKLLAAATVGVLLVGFLIAGAALIATRGTKNLTCGILNEGPASELRKTLDTQGPNFVTGGANCGFYLALQDNNIVAYKVEQPPGCALNLRDQGTRWECGGRTIAAADLEQYPVSIQTIDKTDMVIVNLQSTATSTSIPTATTNP